MARRLLANLVRTDGIYHICHLHDNKIDDSPNLSEIRDYDDAVLLVRDVHTHIALHYAK